MALDRRSFVKWSAASLLALGGATVLGGCGGGTGGGTSSAGDSPGGQGGGEISIFIWSEYLPQEILDNFKAATGNTVNMVTFTSTADMYAKVISSPTGSFDLVDADGIYVKRLIDEGYLEPLDFANIPNFKNMGAGFLKQYFDPDNTYSVPYMGGTAPLCYNAATCPVPIKGYEDLFDPALANSLVLLSDFRVIMGSINKMLGFDFNETDTAKLAQTEAKLMELKPNVKLLDSDSPKTAIINGDCVAGLMYSAEVAIAMSEVPDVKVVFPEQGQYKFQDNLVIAKGTKSKQLCEEFLNYLMEPDVSALVSQVFPYTNPNTAALELLGAEYTSNPAINPPQSALDKGSETLDLPADVLDLYNDIWTRFTQ
jgi:spermidine/putrescine-binding protein